MQHVNVKQDGGLETRIIIKVNHLILNWRLLQYVWVGRGGSGTRGTALARHLGYIQCKSDKLTPLNIKIASALEVASP